MQTFLDYDGSLVGTMHDWTDWINSHAGTNYTILDVTSWDWVSHIQKDLSFNVFDFFKDAEPYKIKDSSLQPIPGSLIFLRECEKLSEKYSPKILTATHDESLREQKDKHSEHHFPGVEVIHEFDKHIYAVDSEGNPCFLFDDKASSCERWVEGGGYAMLYTHNKEYQYAITNIVHDNLKVVDTYEEAIDFMKEVLENRNSQIILPMKDNEITSEKNTSLIKQ